MPLKSRTDLRGSSRILATETIRVSRHCAHGRLRTSRSVSAQPTGPSDALPLRHPSLALAIACIVTAALLHLVVALPIFRWLMPLPGALKIAVSLVLIAPLAFFMGMPFPLALARVAAARSATRRAAERIASRPVVRADKEGNDAMAHAVDRQFAAANEAVMQAVLEIECTITNLFDTTVSLEHVARDYVIERLVGTLIERNPAALDFLNKQRGEASMRLANALMDWRDQWEKR
jgi:hypothetical protein